MNKKILIISIGIILAGGGTWWLLENNHQEDLIDTVSKEYWKSQKVWNYSKVLPSRAANFEKFITNEIIPELKETDVVGELGSASGEYTLKIAPYVNHIDAFEISENMVNSAKKFALEKNIKNVEFNCKAAEDTILQEDKYDKFLCLGLFTCIPNDSAVKNIINNIYKSLKPGGLLFIKDSVVAGKTITHNDGNYAAIYRNENEYFDCFSEMFDIEYKDYIIDNGNYKSVVAVLRKR